MIDGTEKYIVVKTEEWDEWWKSIHALPIGIPSPEFLDDFVVIRLGDIFAAPCLREYANQIETTLEILKESGVSESLRHVGDVSADEFDKKIERLEHIRDYFQSKAELSEGLRRKLPD